MEQLGQLIQNAARPMLVLGGSGWSSEAASAATAFAETLRMPVTTSFRKQDLIDSDNPQYIGSLGPGADPELVSALQRADLLLLAGFAVFCYALTHVGFDVATFAFVWAGVVMSGGKGLWQPPLFAALFTLLLVKTFGALFPYPMLTLVL